MLHYLTSYCHKKTPAPAPTPACTLAFTRFPPPKRIPALLALYPAFLDVVSHSGLSFGEQVSELRAVVRVHALDY